MIKKILQTSAKFICILCSLCFFSYTPMASADIFEMLSNIAASQSQPQDKLEPREISKAFKDKKPLNIVLTASLRHKTLIFAIEHGDVPLIEWLFTQGAAADINKVDYLGMTP